MISLEAGELRLHLDRGPALGPVLEFFSPRSESRQRVFGGRGRDHRRRKTLPSRAATSATLRADLQPRAEVAAGQRGCV